MQRKSAYSQLRKRAAAGDQWAVERLRWHVRRRLGQGWRRETIARRLGLGEADVARYAGIDLEPRLVRPRTSDSPGWSPEDWMERKLAATGLRWTRQAPSRLRQFRLGIVIELDDFADAGADHAANDRAALLDRGVMVIRVRPFDEPAAAEALQAVRLAEAWNARRRALGLSRVHGAD